MLSPQLNVYLRLPSTSSKRILHATKIVEVIEKVYVVQPESQTLPLEPDQELLLYFGLDRQFMQQPIRVNAVIDTEDRPTFGIEVTGEPVSAESRKSYRVSTVISDMSATVDDVADCKLVDVSASGFAVIAPLSFNVGGQAQVSLFHDNASFTGNATVQSVAPFSETQTRYGFYLSNQPHESAELDRAVQKIAMDLQREQLRRLSGSA